MKKLLLFLGIAISAVACNTSLDKKAETTSVPVQQTITADTTGLAAYNAWKAQNELTSLKPQQQAVASSPRVRTIVKHVPVYTAPKKPVHSNRSVANTNSNSSSVENPADNGSGSANSESTETAKAEKKKGWSKAAKGAVIGGVAGAAGGAIINKKNRVLGAVVGGVIGAAGGYGIGRKMDKKDGRIEYAIQ